MIVHTADSHIYSMWTHSSDPGSVWTTSSPFVFIAAAWKLEANHIDDITPHVCGFQSHFPVGAP